MSGRRRNLSPYPPVVYETPKPRFSYGEISVDDDDVDDNNDIFVNGGARAFGRENFGPIVSPYIFPYLYNHHRHFDTRYGIRIDGDSFKIGDSTVLVDTDSHITIKGKEFRGTFGLCCAVDAQECGSRENHDRRSEKI